MWMHNFHLEKKWMKIIRDANEAAQGWVSLSHTHLQRKIHLGPHPKTQRVSNFYFIHILTGKRVYTCTRTRFLTILISIN